MGFLGVLLALFLDAVIPSRVFRHLQSQLRTFTLELEVDLDALGAPKLAWLEWLFPVLLWTAAVGLFHNVLADWSLLLAGLFSVLILAYGLRFSPFVQIMTSLQLYLNQDDVFRARESLLNWMKGLGCPLPTLKTGHDVIRQAVDHGVERLLRQFFAPVFWFVALPGPVGVAFYLCVWWSVLRERELAATDLSGDWPTLHQALQKQGRKAYLSPRFLLYLLEWLPARLMALGMLYRLQWTEALMVWRSAQDHAPMSNRAQIVAITHSGLSLHPDEVAQPEVLVELRKWASEAVLIWLAGLLLLSVVSGI